MIQINDNDTPITVAQKLIHGTKSATITPIMRLGRVLSMGAAPEAGEQVEVDMFSDAEIREIAEYLFTYSKYNRVNEVRAIPAADVVEVKHGYWFVDERPESDRVVTCSACEEPVFRYHDPIDWRPKYCPHCGAKMDGSEEHG